MSLCSECFQEKQHLAKIGDKELCKNCVLRNKTEEVIRKVFKREEVKKEIVARCSKCLNPVYNIDPPRKFHRNFGLEYIFSFNEVEEIVLCKACCQKKRTVQKIKKWMLFLCLITSLFLWVRLFHWKKVDELRGEHPLEFNLFVITIIFIFIIFSSIESILLIPSKIKKAWEYIKHYFIKKEILFFQSQEDSNVYWTNEIYVEKKFDFCSMCQGGDILYKDKIKKLLSLTLRLVKIRVGNKTVKKTAISRFCRSCSKRKIEDLENNPTLKNPKKLKIVKSWYYPTK